MRSAGVHHPRLNARCIKEMVTVKALTKTNIRAPVRVVDEQTGGVSRERP